MAEPADTQVTETQPPETPADTEKTIWTYSTPPIDEWQIAVGKDVHIFRDEGKAKEYVEHMRFDLAWASGR